MKRRNLFLACLLLFVLPLSAARVDTLMVKSPSMNKGGAGVGSDP